MTGERLPDRPLQSVTQSVCPVCLRTIGALRAVRGDTVNLIKECPQHGRFETPVWRGEPALDSWLRPKIPTSPTLCHTNVKRGCPHDCGLCPEHQQRTCCVLLEVTERCNLRCPVCFASAGERVSRDAPLEQVGFWYDRILEASGVCNIQLSGGEPTLRNDLPDIIRLGISKGFTYFQLNTNGLRLADEPAYAQALRDAGLSSVFLQFDGLDDAIYTALRGRPLLDVKRRAVEICTGLGLGVVLVPTMVPGVNGHALGDIVRYALSMGRFARGVHVQPVSHFGRYPKDEQQRLTLPEVIRALEEQTDGLLPLTAFQPSGGMHAMCSFHANFLRMDNGLKPLKGETGCCGPAPDQPILAEVAVCRTRDFVARQWSAPQNASCGCGEPAGDLDAFLQQAQGGTFCVSAMAFQDAWSLDLERLRGCCVHVMSPDGRLMPFCAWNLTAADGMPLYRNRDRSRA